MEASEGQRLFSNPEFKVLEYLLVYTRTGGSYFD